MWLDIDPMIFGGALLSGHAGSATIGLLGAQEETSPALLTRGEFTSLCAAPIRQLPLWLLGNEAKLLLCALGSPEI